MIILKVSYACLTVVVVVWGWAMIVGLKWQFCNSTNALFYLVCVVCSIISLFVAFPTNSAVLSKLQISPNDGGELSRFIGCVYFCWNEFKVYNDGSKLN